MTVHYEASTLGDEDQLLYVYSSSPARRPPTRWLLDSWAATEDRGTSGDRAWQES